MLQCGRCSRQYRLESPYNRAINRARNGSFSFSCSSCSCFCAPGSGSRKVDRCSDPGTMRTSKIMPGGRSSNVRSLPAEEFIVGHGVHPTLPARFPVPCRYVLSCWKETLESRANAVTPMFEAGKVFLPESCLLLHEYQDELATFPAGAHDDMVDSTTQALNYLHLYCPIEPPQEIPQPAFVPVLPEDRLLMRHHESWAKGWDRQFGQSNSNMWFA